jgi:hypothetical protein
MKPDKPDRFERESASKTIADLTDAIEKLVFGEKKVVELEGIIADAKVLVQQWKIREPSGHRRPLFDDTTPPRTLLLAALVVALRRDHKLVEQIQRHFPDELDDLTSKSSDARAWAIVSRWVHPPPPVKAWQKYERNRRRKWHRDFFRSIEYHFGGRFEADFRNQYLLVALSNPPAYATMLSESQDRLDDIFAGKTVNMHTLEELFGMDRHRLAKPLRGLESRRYTYVAVTTIMDFFLNQKPRIRRKKTTPGRSRREPWLNDTDLRMRVLRGIEARINSRSVPSDIASAFLAVIHRHLQESGKNRFRRPLLGAQSGKQFFWQVVARVDDDCAPIFSQSTFAKSVVCWPL